MSSHLLETSDEDSFLLVARFVGDLLNEGQERTALAETTGSRFTAECEALLAEQRYGEYLDRMLGQLDAICTKAQDKDLECCLSILCHLVPRAPEGRDRLTNALAGKTDTEPEARLHALVELYNITEDTQARASVLLRVMQYALTAGLSDLLTPVLKDGLDALGEEGELGDKQQRELLATAAEVYRASKKKRSGVREAFALMTRCFDLLADATSAEVAALKPAVLETLCDYARSPDLYVFDLWDSPAVSQLSNDKEAAPVYQLVNILVTGNVKDFEAFAKSNGAVFDKLGVSQEEVLNKVRVLTIASLAAGKQEVAFKDIQAALGVPAEDVEGWVVRTVGKGLLQGRIDQLAGAVSVTQCSSRTFGRDTWAALRDQLGEWRSRLASMQEVVANQKAAFPKGMLPVIRAA